MAQLPGRISITPLAKFQNKQKTHTVNIHDNNMQVDIKYTRQNIKKDVDYKNVRDVVVKMDDNWASPLTRNVTITTENRQIYEIPDMDTNAALKMKSEIETKRYHASKLDEKPEAKKTSSRTLPFSRYRR